MGEEQVFSFKWDTFHSHLVNSSQEWLADNWFTDVTLVSDDMIPHQAHRLIISSASSVLKQLMKMMSSSNPYLYLKGVSHEELKAILEFIYTGEAYVPVARINKFIKAASEMDIKELNKNIDYKCNEDPPKQISTPTNPSKSIIRQSDENFPTSETDVQNIARCNKCDYSSDRKEELRAHVQSQHMELFPCQECHQTYTDKKDLYSHQKYVHETAPCKQSSNEDSCRSRTKKKIEKLNIPSCSRCSQDFTTTISYLQHMRGCNK